eukprot:2039588-Rhodomonas_salina.2
MILPQHLAENSIRVSTGLAESSAYGDRVGTSFCFCKHSTWRHHALISTARETSARFGKYSMLTGMAMRWRPQGLHCFENAKGEALAVNTLAGLS